MIKKFRLRGIVGQSEKGFSLVEVLISVVILGIISVAVFGALASSSQALAINDTQQTAKNLAESQMEYVKNLGYAASYNPAPVPAEYAGYTVLSPIATTLLAGQGSNIQKIIVTILRDGETVFTLEGYKVN